MANYCSRHGCNYSDGRSCPECRADQAEEDSRDIIDRLSELSETRIDTSELADKLNNPGDYDCPGCDFRTLRYLAKRCPRCHADINDIDAGYWDRVRAREKAQAEKLALRQKAEAEQKVLHEREEAKAKAEANARTGKEMGCFLVVVVIALCVAGVVKLIEDSKTKNSPTRNESYTPPARSYSPPANLVPPEQIIDRGACPYEGCQYGEKWMAKQDVNVYVAPPNTVGAALSSLQFKVLVRAKEWITTETGIVLAKRHEGRVVRGTNYGVVVVNGPPLKIDQTVSLYSYLGENCWTSWIEGRFLVVCSPESQPAKSQNEWWIRIKMADGSQAWTNSRESFVSQEGLNHELGEKIADLKLALPDKLAEIDTLLEGGAELNGDGGKYGTVPIEAAIRTKDADLLKELISKGLNIRNNQLCPAYFAAQNALSPNGDLMLQFLLENGMQLSCLTNPPLREFLIFGMALDTYPIDRAIKVAEMLIKHGVSVDQRDSQGKSIFDILNEKDMASRPHVAVLREALIKLKNRQ